MKSVRGQRAGAAHARSPTSMALGSLEPDVLLALDRGQLFERLVRGGLHRLGNSLQAIVLAAKTLGLTRRPEARQRLEAVLQGESADLEAVLVGFSAIGGQGEPSRLPVSTVLEQLRVLDRYHRLAPAVTVSVEAEATVARRLVPAGPLLHVLLNLVVNAREALAAAGSGTVRVVARAAGRGVEVRVEDDGPGIPDGQRETIFRPFVSGKPDRAGLGIGLTVARWLAECEGGWLEARRPAGGRGACFVAWLPSPPGAEAGALGRALRRPAEGKH